MAQTGRVSGVSTNVKEERGWTIVRYHSTDVVRFNQHEIILNTGGWRTATTKLRMNQTANQYRLGFNVFQTKGMWHVVIQRDGRTVPFDTDTLSILR